MFYWYQNCWLNWSKWFIYLQLVFNWYLFTIGIKWYLNQYLFYIPHCVLSIMYFQLVYFIDIMMHSIDIFFFQMVSRKFCFWFYPSLIFCLRQKGDSVFFDPFVDDWQKGGERFWVYICIFVFLHILSFMLIWEFKQKERRFLKHMFD